MKGGEEEGERERKREREKKERERGGERRGDYSLIRKNLYKIRIYIQS